MKLTLTSPGVSFDEKSLLLSGYLAVPIVSSKKYIVDRLKDVIYTADFCKAHCISRLT